MKRITTRLSALLLMAVLCIINLARAQDVTPTSVLAGRRLETGEPLRRFVDAPIFLPPTGRSVIRVQPGPWTMQTLAAVTKNEVASLFGNVATERSEQEIIRKYYDLSSLSLKGRRASFRRASPAEKSGLWRTHLALVLVRRPELNEWQKDIILATILLLTPEHYEVPSSSPEWKTKVREPSRLLEQQITLAFSSDDAAKIFTTLGDNTEAAKNSPIPAGSLSLKSINYQPVSDSGPYNQWIHSRFSAQDVELEQSATCGCNLTWDFCGGWKYCNASACAPQQGCGLGWSYPCNGVCR